MNESNWNHEQESHPLNDRDPNDLEKDLVPTISRFQIDSVDMSDENKNYLSKFFEVVQYCRLEIGKLTELVNDIPSSAADENFSETVKIVGDGYRAMIEKFQLIRDKRFSAEDLETSLWQDFGAVEFTDQIVELKNVDLYLSLIKTRVHDINIPLTSILGFVTTLEATDVTWDEENIRRFLNLIKSEEKDAQLLCSTDWHEFLNKELIAEKDKGFLEDFFNETGSTFDRNEESGIQVSISQTENWNKYKFSTLFVQETLESLVRNISSNAEKSYLSIDENERPEKFLMEIELDIDPPPNPKLVIKFRDNGRGGVGSMRKEFEEGQTKWDQEEKITGTGIGMFSLSETVRVQFGGDLYLSDRSDVEVIDGEYIPKPGAEVVFRLPINIATPENPTS